MPALVDPFAAAALPGAWDGKRLSAKADLRTPRRVFAVTLPGVATFMVVDSIVPSRRGVSSTRRVLR
ncbi:hypothetical protein [Saccharothrix australiensis]|uniref:Uncharacterized protein n=1 Tax=Saccharothrix australiensis TaxID=2072 RepID=A0A495W080_9PSEU|nr:hypothetical protein [Saccharothrix australiensis]RKT54085.1 hypothetical protein C8E97_2675 [Saccharothrix australiensis]